MPGPGLFLIAVVIVVTVAAGWALRRGRQGGAAVADPMVRSAAVAARRRVLGATGCALAVLVLAGYVATLRPEWLGLPLAVGPAIATATGLLLYAATPPERLRAESNRRVASLEPRAPWSFASRRTLGLLVLVAVAQVSLLIGTGLTSSPDDAGRYRVVTYSSGGVSSTASPYPGWFYGVPLMIVTVLLAVATLVAFWRIAATPSLPVEGLATPDRRRRVDTTRIIAGLGLGGLLLQLGGTSAAAGSALGNVLDQPGAPGEWRLVAAALFWLGLLCAVAGIVSVTVAVSRGVALKADLATGPVSTGGRTAALPGAAE
ncbi:hypothetical protein FFT09_14365 [Saccharomonospora piscinae]|uniref:hypothetical protein n=1 Tax=Saccharomonospora piscinae TaxID=687388 RepID=UPI001105B954|nr:hypothetical protein [Saccharomonospora piscinae]TLW92068.1 hypothetical protein FFT09_14365 [Saccharomonospora piscinae]